MAHSGGRPTKYNPGFTNKLNGYIEKCRMTFDIPFREEFCVDNDIPVDRYEDWCKSNKEFSRADKRLGALQKFMLMKNSAIGKYNAVSSIFQLKANHGMIETEKKLLEHSGGVTLSWIDEPTDRDTVHTNASSEADASE